MGESDYKTSSPGLGGASRIRLSVFLTQRRRLDIEDISFDLEASHLCRAVLFDKNERSKCRLMSDS